MLVAVIAGACSGSGQRAAVTPSPTATATQSPPNASPSALPVAGPFAVLATNASPDLYTVSVVSIDGKVTATAKASFPWDPQGCGPPTAAAPVPPPVSTSNARVYFMDRQGAIRYLTPHGDTGLATTVPIGATRHSMFSVSPDDRRISVAVSDYTVGSVSLRLYVEDLIGGTNHVDIFSSTGAFGLWPVGWHGSNLIVAKVHACVNGGGPFCCGMLELHVVDPTTAVRRYTMGSPQCVIAGPLSPAGAICEDTQHGRANVLDWTGAVTRSFPVSRPTPALLAPDGTRAALNLDANNTGFDTVPMGLHLYVCGWFDSTHVIGWLETTNIPGGGSQTLIADVGTGTMVPVAAQGGCAGRIPGGL
jgi:hypothetical protein